MEEDKKAKQSLRERAKKVRVKLADPSGTIAQELYAKNVELARTNHTLTLLRTIDNLVLETSNSLQQLSNGMAQALIDNSNYLFSAIFIPPASGSSQPLKLEGYGIVSESKPKIPDESVLKALLLHQTHDWFKGEETTVTVNPLDPKDSTLKSFFSHDGLTVHHIVLGLGINTLFFAKLMARKKLVGVLAVGLAEAPKDVGESEIMYMARVSEAAGLALDNKLLFEENQVVLKKLRQSNQKLKELDEAKDEFISMASHQLRTPLTSVKGYVSMVIEGDAGRIPKAQKELLEQAFGSAQRMVYLIADLLNVSRLKTGKFVIEAAPTKLNEVVESEISQLIETAKAHNLELKYEKPDNFPVVNLDETKTRQVIMNFIDNAIYYTPPGGHIRVELGSTEKMVEFKVIDDGLGVPKAEQPHLFTKFYRAGNAKKARPDGTGLGLFMAKKVIIAQGGSLIFSSTEGKGSTFGFSFPLHPAASHKTVPHAVK